MRKFGKRMVWVAVLVALLLLAGCCDNPGVFGKVNQSMNTVQGFYDPLVGQFLDDKTNTTVQAAVVAADTALMIGGELQNQFCPDSKQAEQLALQAQQAQQLAQQAGVK